VHADHARGQPQQEGIRIDTSNILFVLTGAFNGIEEIVQSRLGKKGIGFGAGLTKQSASKNELRAKVLPEDLIKFGMIAEFVGRVPMIVSCDELDTAALVDILWRPRNALIRQYQRLMAMEGVKLTFTAEAMQAIAEIAHGRHAGARGLRSVLEDLMLDVMYDIPSIEGITECVVDESAVRNNTGPRLIRSQEAAS
jgi:ATP-dependent Clp protease ATP-binding subunit ClpX